MRVRDGVRMRDSVRVRHSVRERMRVGADLAYDVGGRGGVGHKKMQ